MKIIGYITIKKGKRLNMNTLKRLIMPLMFALVLALGTQVAMAQDNNSAKIVVPEDTYDFGTIKEGDGNVSHVFIVKNTGSAPLVITRVVSSCGCTTPEFTKEPIAPGKTGEIKVIYNPSGRVYPFNKTVSIYSNGKQGPLVLTIKGEVVE